MLTPFLLTLLLGAAPDVGPPAPVDLNLATEAELMTLPGVGAKRAQAIIAHRPFLRVRELRRVRGIGAKRFAKLRPRVRVAAFPRPKPRPRLRRVRPVAPLGCVSWAGPGPGVPP